MVGAIDWPTAVAVLGSVGIVSGAAVKIFRRDKGGNGGADNGARGSGRQPTVPEVESVKNDVAKLKTDVAVLTVKQDNLSAQILGVAKSVDRNHDRAQADTAIVSSKIDAMGATILRRLAQNDQGG